jgi:hypothetical protein
MIRALAAVLIALAVTLAPARAQVAETFPVSIRAENPYAAPLREAKAAYETARTRYDQAARYAYYSWAHYQAYYRAYYELWSAYGRYAYYLRAYSYHENNQPRRAVTGVVLVPPQYGILPADPPPGYLDPKPVAGATVQLFRADLYTIQVYPPPRPAPVRTAVTDASGRFTFSDLDFTKGRLQITYPNHKTVSHEFTVTQGTVSLRFVLEYTGLPVPIAHGGGISMDDLNRR